jgi:gamma-glutamyltranspeptidase
VCPHAHVQPLFKDSAPYAMFGFKGDHASTLVRIQVLLNLIDHHMMLQEAISAPHLNQAEGTKVDLEPGVSHVVTGDLSGRGYHSRALFS